ncbi:hypothetical protein RM96_19765 [Cupriavidus sp. IDO]|nr:hypothetical protein RM96_19765 [Cupriavidus sp. IDO]
MRSLVQIGAVVASAAVLAGCAHPIVMATEKSAPTEALAQKIDKNVGYVIPAGLREKEIVTPGGGGDKVSYFPYRDIELPMYSTLSNVFANVSKLKAPNDEAAIRNGQISYIVTREMVTDSSSDSALTWPPTQFTIKLTCTVTDLTGAIVLKKEVSGVGKAEFSEFKRNFALSAHRASEDALKQLQAALASAPELRNASIQPSPIVVAPKAAATQ